MAARLSSAIWASAAMLLLLAVPGIASPAGLTRLPALFRGGDVYLQVTLNGQRPVWMKFDLGADSSSISSNEARLASRASPPLQSDDARRSQPSNIDIALGPLVFRNVAFERLRTSNSLGPDGESLVGKLGENFLGDRILVIRYREREVWISAAVPAVASGRAPTSAEARLAAAAQPF